MIIAFYVIKNYRPHSISEIKKAGKSLTKFKKSLRFKKFRGNIGSVDYDDFADDDEYRKIGSIRILFKEFDRDYYKPIWTDGGFAGRRNNYIEYKSKGDRYENLSPEEYLNMIRPYLRDLINDHKPAEESNNEDSNNNNSNNKNNSNNNNEESDRAEWEIQPRMQNSCISTKCFEETRTIYSKSEPVEIFMGSNTNDVIDRLFNTLYKDFNMHKKHQMIKKANLFLKVLNYYIIIFKK